MKSPEADFISIKGRLSDGETLFQDTGIRTCELQIQKPTRKPLGHRDSQTHCVGLIHASFHIENSIDTCNSSSSRIVIRCACVILPALLCLCGFKTCEWQVTLRDPFKHGALRLSILKAYEALHMYNCVPQYM